MVTALKPTLPTAHDFRAKADGSTFQGPPEETCHWCGCDPRNVIHDVTPKPPDEIIAAQRDGLAAAVVKLLEHYPVTAFAYPAAQDALCAVQACLLELGHGPVDRFAEVNLLWLASKELGR